MSAEAGKLIADAELAALTKWHPTSDFALLVADLDRRADGYSLLTERRLKPLQEALLVRDLAMTVGFSECRLVPAGERFPDAEVRLSGITTKLEITRVDSPGRRIVAEYRKLQTSDCREPLSHHEWNVVRENRESWASRVLEAIKKKLRYDPKIKFDIVVYNNIGHLFELPMPEIERLSQAVGEALNEAGFDFHQVWHCRSTTIDRLWPTVFRRSIPGFEDRF